MDRLRDSPLSLSETVHTPSHVSLDAVQPHSSHGHTHTRIRIHAASVGSRAPIVSESLGFYKPGVTKKTKQEEEPQSPDATPSEHTARAKAERRPPSTAQRQKRAYDGVQAKGSGGGRGEDGKAMTTHSTWFCQSIEQKESAERSHGRYAKREETKRSVHRLMRRRHSHTPSSPGARSRTVLGRGLVLRHGW